MRSVHRFAAAAALVAACSFPAFGQTADVRPRDLRASLIGHAHIDLSWLWRWEETVHDVAVQTFRGTLAQMEKMRGLTFAQSQAALYEAVETAYPDLFASIRAKIRAGTWIPVGGMWVEPDLNMPDGEALARQLLYGKRYFLDKFGVDVKVGWNPDSFGHNAQLPQILSKAGIRYYVFGRCAPENAPAFWWTGPDGSRLLCYVPQGWYNVSLQEGIVKTLQTAAKTSPLRDYMILYGAGDHGGGPRDSDLAAIDRFRKDKSQPKPVFVSPEAYFRGLEAGKMEFPTVNRELNFTFPACYTTQADTKKGNRRLEGLLVTAEVFSTLAVTSGWRDYYPERDLDEAWKILLRNQFHDILDGSSIGPVYDEVRRFTADAQQRGRRALDFSLETIANMVDTRGVGTPLLVFNPLAWARTDAVTLAVPEGAAGGWTVTDARGQAVPAQVVQAADERGRTAERLVFVAGNVPSLGYKLFRLSRASAAAAPEPAVKADKDGLENEFLRVTIDPKTGWIAGIYDKAAGRTVLRGPARLEAILDEPESMSAWELGLKETVGFVGEDGASIEVVESGPVRAVVRASAPFRNSRFVQEMILVRGQPRLDIRLRLNWQERNIMIKAAFPLAVDPAAADFEIPFGVQTRPVDGAEVPALRWIDVADASGRYGVSLLNDCRYGFDVKGPVARVSVIHGATNPDPEADRGDHELMIALYPHAGTWKDGGTWQRAYEFNQPLLPRPVMAHPGSLPAENSFVQVGPQNVVLSALKKETGYYERSLIVRLFETHGRRTESRLEVPWPVEALDVDLIERPAGKSLGTGQVITVPLEPYEIRTIKLVRK